MYVEALNVRNFRNLENVDIVFSPGLTVFTGANAQGKTNTLEAVLLSLSGRSHRESLAKNFIGPYGKSAQIKLSVVYADGTKCAVSLYLGEDKQYTIDGEALSSRRTLLKNFSLIFFSPEDLKLVKEGPDKRRSFLNEALCLVSYQYIELLATYNKALKLRNILLKNYSASKLDLLEVYDEILAGAGSQIAKYRIKFLRGYETHLNDFYEQISKRQERISLRYVSNIIESVRDADKEAYLRKLCETRAQDISLASTQTGIHHDDILICLDGKDARRFASQGQQRSVAVSMKLALTKMFEEVRREPPVVLLDDVLSELDETRQTGLLKALHGIQTIITCVDDSFIENAGQLIRYRVENGTLKRKI